jgi:hypothetical protein
VTDDHVVPAWASQWLEVQAFEVTAEQAALLEHIDKFLPRSSVWTDEAGRTYEGLALEGSAPAPRVVVYLRSPRRPGIPLAFEWSLGLGPGTDDWAVFLAHLMEDLDEAGSSLPSDAGPDGVARFGAVRGDATR